MTRTVIALLITLGGLSAAELTLVPGKSVPLPEGWTVTGTAPVHLITPTHAPHIQVWTLTGTTVAAAEARLAALVESQVKDLVVKTTTPITVAGTAGKHLTCTGTEADDGDPANAEIDLFPCGDQVVLVLSHGEGPGPAATRPVIDVLIARIP